MRGCVGHLLVLTDFRRTVQIIVNEIMYRFYVVHSFASVRSILVLVEGDKIFGRVDVF